MNAAVWLLRSSLGLVDPLIRVGWKISIENMAKHALSTKALKNEVK